MAASKTTRPPRATNGAGAELLEGVRQMHRAVTSGDLSGFTVHKHEVRDPADYSSGRVIGLRSTLGISQAMFAHLIGVSKDVVAQWESGSNKPSPAARRLMDQVRARPLAFAHWLLRNFSPRPRKTRIEEVDNAVKEHTKELIELAARVLSRSEMMKAIQHAYREPAHK